MDNQPLVDDSTVNNILTKYLSNLTPEVQSSFLTQFNELKESVGISHYTVALLIENYVETHNMPVGMYSDLLYSKYSMIHARTPRTSAHKSAAVHRPEKVKFQEWETLTDEIIADLKSQVTTPKLLSEILEGKDLEWYLAIPVETSLNPKSEGISWNDLTKNGERIGLKVAQGVHSFGTKEFLANGWLLTATFLNTNKSRFRFLDLR